MTKKDGRAFLELIGYYRRFIPPIAFASRKLLPRKMKYSIIEKECLAVVWALKFFHVYLYGQSFVIQTDHQPLAWLQRMKNTNSRLTRWALAIQTYCLTMMHPPGKNNGNADGLSRGPLTDKNDSLTSPGNPDCHREGEGV